MQGPILCTLFPPSLSNASLNKFSSWENFILHIQSHFNTGYTNRDKY